MILAYDSSGNLIEASVQEHFKDALLAVVRSLVG
jgi:hypothetical protein